MAARHPISHIDVKGFRYRSITGHAWTHFDDVKFQAGVSPEQVSQTLLVEFRFGLSSEHSWTHADFEGSQFGVLGGQAPQTLYAFGAGL